LSFLCLSFFLFSNFSNAQISERSRRSRNKSPPPIFNTDCILRCHREQNPSHSLFRRHGCGTSEEIFWKLRSIQAFIQDLHWPDEIFAEHMTTRLKLMAADMTAACIDRFIIFFFF